MVSSTCLVKWEREHHKKQVCQWSHFFSLDGRAFRAMLDELCSLIQQRKLTAPSCTEVHLRDYQKALDAAMQPFSSSKQVLIMWKFCFHQLTTTFMHFHDSSTRTSVQPQANAALSLICKPVTVYNKHSFSSGSKFAVCLSISRSYIKVTRLQATMKRLLNLYLNIGDNRSCKGTQITVLSLMHNSRSLCF